MARPATAASASLRLLGVPAMVDAHHQRPLPPRRPYQLLAYLACRRTWVGRAELAEMFWPDRAEGAARGNLRTLLLRAKPWPGLEALELQAERVRWLPPTDLDVFEAAAAAGLDEELLALPWGPLLEGLDNGLSEPAARWLEHERERLAALWRNAAQRRIAALQRADPAAALALAERLVALDPWDDGALLALAEAAAVLGEPARGAAALRAHARRLQAEHGLPLPAALRAALSRLEDFAPGDPAAAARQRAAAMPTSAPAARMPQLIGRRRELADIVAAFSTAEAVRALVLTGPGGIGKTTLAQAALPLLEPQVDGGAHWVPLAELSDVAQLGGRIAQVLGLPQGAEAGSQLVARLATRPTLLALDNAEHLGGLAEAVGQLLASCPALRVLITSRTRIGFSNVASRAYRLEGLPLPDADERSPALLRAFDSVRLFETRALAVEPAFSLAGQADAVVRLLHAVQGMPLAIELGAAMVPVLPVADIVAALEDSLDVLDAAVDDGAAPALRALRGCFQRSWSLLGAGLQQGLARLAVLPAAFDREMAERVAGVSLPALVRLHEASLLHREEAAGRRGAGSTAAGTAAGLAGAAGAASASGPAAGALAPARFVLHALLRLFIRDAHPLAGEASDALAARHAALVGHRIEALDQPGQLGNAASLDALEDQLAHVRAAWRQVATRGPPALAARFARVLGRYHVSRGRIDEALPAFAAALAALHALDPAGRAGQRARAVTLRTQAMLEFHGGHLTQAAEHARLALRWATQAGDPHTAVGCLTVLGNSLWRTGDEDAAERHFRQAVARGERLGDAAVVSAATTGLGIVARMRGDFESALGHYRQARSTASAMGNVAGELSDLNNIADVLQALGRQREAIDALDEALELAARHRLDGLRALMLTNAAYAHLALGQSTEARQRLVGAAQWAASSSASNADIERFLCEASLEVLEGRPDAAAGPLAQALAAAEQGTSTLLQLHCIEVAGEWLLARGDSQAAAAQWLWLLQQPGSSAPMRGRVAVLLDALSLDAATRLALEARLPAAGSAAAGVTAALEHNRAALASARPFER